MKTVKLSGVICVRDDDGISLWTPNAEATIEIIASCDPEAKAVEICTDQPMRGRWAN